MNHVVAVSETQEQKRQRTNLSRLHSGEEFRLGSGAGLPWTMEVLAAITGDDPCVMQTLESALTAAVNQVAAENKRDVLKRARPTCLVRNIDGEASLLGEFLCRQHIYAVRRESPDRLQSITHTCARRSGTGRCLRNGSTARQFVIGTGAGCGSCLPPVTISCWPDCLSGITAPVTCSMTAGKFSCSI